MTKDQALKHYKTGAAIAAALGIDRAAVYQWIAIPLLRQLQLEIHSRGKLRADRAAKQPARAAARA